MCAGDDVWDVKADRKGVPESNRRPRQPRPSGEEREVTCGNARPQGVASSSVQSGTEAGSRFSPACAHAKAEEACATESFSGTSIDPAQHQVLATVDARRRSKMAAGTAQGNESAAPHGVGENASRHMKAQQEVKLNRK